MAAECFLLSDAERVFFFATHSIGLSSCKKTTRNTSKCLLKAIYEDINRTEDVWLIKVKQELYITRMLQ